MTETVQEMQEWIERIIRDTAPSIPTLSTTELTLTQAHTALLHLESDFQTRLFRWQDEQTLTHTQLLALHKPLHTITTLFDTFNISKVNEGTPGVHIETTLRVLKGLLDSYDGISGALGDAVDAIAFIDARQVITAQHISAWSSQTLSTLNYTRAVLLAQSKNAQNQKAEVELLQDKLVRCERERDGAEGIIVSLVSKLENGEEESELSKAEIKKLKREVMELKSQARSVHRGERSIVSQLRKHPHIGREGTREAAEEYSRKLDAKNIVEQTLKRLSIQNRA